MSKYLVFFIAAGVISRVALAQQLPPLPEMERVLLPVTVVGVPGAFGSVWSSQGSQFRDLDRPVLILPGCEQPCDNPGGPTARHTLPLDFLRTRGGETSGSIMYIERAFSDSVFLSRRLLEVSTGQTLQLPVVREHSFFTRRFEILDVPNPAAGTRSTLRIYGIEPNILGKVEVRVFAEGTEQLARDDVYDLAVVQRFYSTAAYSVPVRPPVAEMSYYVPFVSTTDLLRFEIEPLTANMPIWAFMSVTDNGTQRVELRTPQ